MTDAGGEYYGVRSTIKITAYPEYLQFGTERVAYDRILQIAAKEEILFIRFLDSNDKNIEGYLKYNPFLPSAAAKKLREFVRIASQLVPKRSLRAGNSSNAVLAGEGETEANRSTVIVNSSKVSFPPFCPACFKPASKVAKFEVVSIVPTSDLLKIGFWLIPVCHLHKNPAGHLTVKNWSPTSSETAFTFKNRLYAEAFLNINQKPLDERFLTNENTGRLRNFKYVIYEYYISAVVISFLQLSDVQELKAAESKFVRGLKYNAITLTAGWWSFPFGPIYTLIVLFKNLFGGVDVTERVVAVYQGKPFAALED